MFISKGFELIERWTQRAAETWKISFEVDAQQCNTSDWVAALLTIGIYKCSLVILVE